jgi:WD40 repeat protein
MTAENDVESTAAAPLLMLDTGGHMALINDIAFTPDGQQLVSASDDKTIRVWDLATGKTVRTLRGEERTRRSGQNLRHGAVARWQMARGGGMDVDPRRRRASLPAL